MGFTKLVSIIMIGQPELGVKLSERNADVREVVQRCERVTLTPVDHSRLGEFLTFRFDRVGTDLNHGFLTVGQGKTEKRLRIRLYNGDNETDLCIFINGLLDRRTQAGTRTSILITNQAGLRMSYNMLRNRWDEAREKAATIAALDGDAELAIKIRMFQFRDIRPKAGSEIEDIKDASRLLGHSTEEMTKKVYRRLGEIVKPTK